MDDYAMPCPICGRFIFNKPGSFDTCQYCGWEDDGLQSSDKPFLTDLRFCESLDFEDGRIASMHTMGGDSDLEIPVNVFAEPGSDDSLTEGTVCTVELSAAAYEIDVYASAEDVSGDTGMADFSLIPMGTFPLDPDDPDFRQNPWISFSGKVVHLALRRCRDSASEDCDYALCVTVKTLDMLVTFELECNAEVEIGEYWHGAAFLSAVIRKKEAANDGEHTGTTQEI